MSYNPDIHHRRSIRLKGYDYRQPGAYFLTICTHNRACLFGHIVAGEIRLNDAGGIAEQCWLDIPTHFPQTRLDAYVVMPNHVHGIVWIVKHAATEDGARMSVKVSATGGTIHDIGTSSRNTTQHPGTRNGVVAGSLSAPRKPPPHDPHAFRPRGTSKTIRAVVRGFKIGVTRWFRQNTDIEKVWHRNYFDRIIRNDDALARIREYIIANPMNWMKK